MIKQLSVQGIVDLASAYYSSAVLFAAIDAGVFTHVKNAGPEANAENLAKAAGCDGRGMRLLLDACAAIGLLKKDSAGVYSNTEASEIALVSGAPHDLTRAIRYNRDVYPAWGRLLDLVKTGKPVENPMNHLGGDAARTKAFAAAMYARAVGIGRCVVPMLGLGDGDRKVLDLAGGPAAYACLMARNYPGIEKVVTVDLPAISAEAADIVRREKLEDKVQCRAGDWHCDAWEKNEYDVATVFGALHQESPESIKSILKKVFDSLKPGGRIFILDMMTDSTRIEPVFSALFAVNMALTMPNGWVFSDSELFTWLEESGFKDCNTRSVPPPMPHWLVSAVKPSNNQGGAI